MPFASHLLDDVTYWPVTGTNGFGGFTYGAPTLLKGRWEDKSELFLTNDNEEEASKSIVYLNSDVDVGDYLREGDSATTPVVDPTTLVDAFRVRQRHKTTSLSRAVCLRKVFL